MERTEIAKNYFAQKCHCSQAVLASFADALGITEETALKFGACFGGGMRKGEVCGACTGALMALGMKFGMSEIGDFKKQQIADGYARRFLDEFAKQNGSYLCRDLLKRNLASDEERQKAREEGLFASVCPKMIESAVRISEQMMQEKV